jgi:hypothetical protein
LDDSDREAAIDPVTGCIVVTYYDNRNGGVNAGGPHRSQESHAFDR